MGPTYSFASIIEPSVFGDNFTRENYNKIAETLITNRNFIANMNLAPDGIIKHVEPITNRTKNVINTNIMNNNGALETIQK